MDNPPSSPLPSPDGTAVTCIPDYPEATNLEETVDDSTSLDVPSSSLDALETSRGLASTLPIPCPRDLSRKLCQSFRHGGWLERRQRTAAAIAAAGGSPARIERFSRCGDTAWVLQASTDHNRFRLATNRCRDRFCVPCANEHRQVVCRNLRAALAGRTLRLMTLTLKSSDAPLTEQLSRLYKSWSRLRALLKHQHGLVGGIAFTELTLNDRTRLWHPHLHVIFEGQWVPKQWVKSEWLRITGDSFIVDLRPLKDADHAAGYVAKYASKAISANVVLDRDRFPEAIAALQAHRLFATFGTWTGLHLSRHPEDDVGWEPLRPLYLVILDARSGDVTARAILSALRGSACDDPLTILRDDSP